MKTCGLMLIIVLAGCPVQAQRLAEFFQQKKTQISYLIRQTEALQTYLGYLEKGYRIAEVGLDIIRDLKHGEWNLHDTYYRSLKSISPAVAHDDRIAGIIILQIRILQCCKKGFQMTRNKDVFSPEQDRYLSGVYTSLLKDCSRDMTTLLALTTPGRLQLTDEQRIERIGGLYLDMEDRYTFIKKFNEYNKLLLINMLNEHHMLSMMKANYGISNQ